jgi:UDP-N-acetylmuramate-alanine ligase
MGCFPLSDRHIHILGICGTFMGGVAALARELGIRVSGSDREVYPPMSDQLQDLGIVLQEGYDAGHMEPPPDEVVVGNALSRGNPAVEAMLERWSMTHLRLFSHQSTPDAKRSGARLSRPSN